MSEEEMKSRMEFILQAQAQVWANLQKVEESHNRSVGRIDRLEHIVKLIINAGLRARRQMREDSEEFKQRFAKVTEALNELAKAQARTEASRAHTDKRLDALIDIVREGRSGKSK
jgi:galactokinase